MPPLALFESALTPFIVLLLSTLDVSPHNEVASDLQLSADTDEGCAKDDPVDPNTVFTELPNPEVDPLEPEPLVADENKSHLELFLDRVLIPEELASSL